MSVVDDRGRVFGRWNIVDALIGLVLLVLIPLLYGGYALFRAHPPTLTAIEPAQIQAKTNVEVTVRGTNLRPYMRVSFNDTQGRSFLFANETKAVVQVVDMPPGVYDVILYDNAQERSRLPKAFTVVAAPRSESQVDVIGTFMAIAANAGGEIKPGLKIDGLGEVTRVGTPRPASVYTAVAAGEAVAVPSAAAVNVPAIIRATCAIVERGGGVSCVAMDRALMRDVVLTATLPSGSALFQVDQVKPLGADTAIEMRARFAGERSVVELMKRGDQDVERNNEFATGAEITAIGGVARANSTVIIAMQSQATAAPTIAAGDIATVEATLRVPVQQTVDGWWYRGQVLKPGRTFTFHQRSYDLSATILSVTAK